MAIHVYTRWHQVKFDAGQNVKIPFRDRSSFTPTGRGGKSFSHASWASLSAQANPPVRGSPRLLAMLNGGGGGTKRFGLVLLQENTFEKLNPMGNLVYLYIQHSLYE